MDGWNTTFLLGRPSFRGYVSFREGIQVTGKKIRDLTYCVHLVGKFSWEIQHFAA